MVAYFGLKSERSPIEKFIIKVNETVGINESL